MSDLAALRRKLITANHVLHHHAVVDAYGHISVRHPSDPAIYIMSGYMAPGVVSSSADLIEYYVSDGSTVDPKAKKGYSERFIHGEMYRMFPGVNCVVHSHAEDVLPYVVVGVPLRAVFHMAGFLGSEVPVFDIAPLYAPGDQQDMLVNNMRFGAALASEFIDQNATPFTTSTSTAPSSSTKDQVPQPTHTVVLMRRHGYTTHGADIETAVYRAIYTKINAGVQTSALGVRGNFAAMQQGSSSKKNANVTENVEEMEMKFEFEPLTAEQCKGCIVMNEGTQDKPWRLWVQEVESSALYRNDG